MPYHLAHTAPAATYLDAIPTRETKEECHKLWPANKADPLWQKRHDNDMDLSSLVDRTISRLCFGDRHDAHMLAEVEEKSFLIHLSQTKRCFLTLGPEQCEVTAAAAAQVMRYLGLLFNTASTHTLKSLDFQKNSSNCQPSRTKFLWFLS